MKFFYVLLALFGLCRLTLGVSPVPVSEPELESEAVPTCAPCVECVVPCECPEAIVKVSNASHASLLAESYSFSAVTALSSVQHQSYLAYEMMYSTGILLQKAESEDRKVVVTMRKALAKVLKLVAERKKPCKYSEEKINAMAILELRSLFGLRATAQGFVEASARAHVNVTSLVEATATAYAEAGAYAKAAAHASAHATACAEASARAVITADCEHATIIAETEAGVAVDMVTETLNYVKIITAAETEVTLNVQIAGEIYAQVQANVDGIIEANLEIKTIMKKMKKTYKACIGKIRK